RYDVAIGTVRKAVDLLVADGMLERYQGRGTFVRRASFDSTLFRFFRFQGRHGERRIPESPILRREVVEAPSAVAAALQIPAR
ncbi:GntR family transcriptional regulator, partial [Burkholderia pseudomallei]